ncbi:MAG: aldehyde dehydrogenase family protein, partial [Chitinophagaceae bacterium]|nr:aldehyde dehydrogenase family protein [Chitinophagaceae bacterium]
MKQLNNYIQGQWMAGTGNGQLLTDAVTGEPIAQASTEGIDFKSVVEYGRKVGNPALRSLTFHERGLRLKALALHLQKHLPAFYALSYKTGATKADSWVDIEGGIGNLFANASLRRKFPNETFCIDGESHNLSKQNTFMGTHLLVPKEGVAIHINAFNFPVWGMLEKIAVNLLAGVPAIVKPATITSYLTEAVFKEIIASKIFPEASLQLLCGSAGNLLEWVDSQDSVTFTGSAHTGALLKRTPSLLANNVSFTMEADSLNCIVLGESVQPN